MGMDIDKSRTYLQSIHFQYFFPLLRLDGTDSSKGITGNAQISNPGRTTGAIKNNSTFNDQIESWSDFNPQRTVNCQTQCGQNAFLQEIAPINKMRNLIFLWH